MKSKLEMGLIEGEDLIKKGGAALVNNVGKTIAFITVFVTVLITFTDVSFADFGTESFATGAVMLLLASYLMYFSLEDAGERLCEESEEYKQAILEYEKEKKKICGEDIDALRRFSIEYSKEELEYRKRSFIAAHALSYSDFEKYLRGEKFFGKEKRLFKKAKKLKAASLSPRILLTKDRENKGRELVNPEKFKLLHLIVKLIPTTVCMTVTVSVILTAKAGLDAGGVIEGILKLSTLPIVGFRGYANGYSYVRKSYIPWIETKKRLLEAFNQKKSSYA